MEEEVAEFLFFFTAQKGVLKTYTHININILELTQYHLNSRLMEKTLNEMNCLYKWNRLNWDKWEKNTIMFCYFLTLFVLVALVSWVNAEEIGKYSCLKTSV